MKENGTDCFALFLNAFGKHILQPLILLALKLYNVNISSDERSLLFMYSCKKCRINYVFEAVVKYRLW